jgi:molybdate transport system substrate-binding protein
MPAPDTIAAMPLMLLSAGAAKGLVNALAPEFLAATRAAIDAEFDAVGAIRERLVSGAPCDAIILTAALLEALEREGAIVARGIFPIGRVETGVAARAGDALPDIHDSAALRAALQAAPAVFVPDVVRSTAGMHFAGLLQRLGVDTQVMPRVHAFANGATAMRALAELAIPGALGCTQVTEILYTPGVALAGTLPPGCGLATVYAAAVAARARAPDLARTFIELLTGPGSREARRRGGFDVD